ncbi:MAG: hypothetical protein CMD83_02370 [Gammaproteobacteria bacterium]|nr:hypothetical protein [Gammaproteobacteria bacterium]
MIELIVLLSLLGVGFITGRIAEKRHYASILIREAELASLLIVPSKHPPVLDQPPDTRLVHGSVVVSVDYFKQFVAGLRMIFGGRLVSYESLLDRARREAILRMKSRARSCSASMVFNVKLETASISKGSRDTIGSIEVYAYGTAIIPRDGV